MEYLFVLLPYSLCLLAAYAAFTVIYRLYFHPLAKFPGPKLNATTRLVELYYEVFHERGGKYEFEIEKMHKKYGPIVRISPFELHIDDNEFYSELFTGVETRNAEKYPFAVNVLGEGSVQSAIDPNIHRMRRKSLDPYFSKANVYKLEPIIWRYTKRLFERLDEFRVNKKPFKLGYPVSAWGVDILTSYCFAFTYDYLGLADFGEALHVSNDEATKLIVTGQYFPFLFKMLKMLPVSLLKLVIKDAERMFEQLARFDTVVEDIQSGKIDADNPETHHTVIHDLFANESLPPSERTKERISLETQNLITGNVTTSHVVDKTIVYVLSDKEVERKLRESVAKVMAGFPENPPRLTQLEEIDYLRGVIHEGLRLATPVSHRLQRLLPQPIQYKNYTIPPNTPIGMSTPFIHLNSTSFPDPHKFIPERWIDTRGLPVLKHFAAFSKGPRNCLGINLVFGELFILIAAMFGPNASRMHLHETGFKDIALVHDYFEPNAHPSSKGVRVSLT